MPVQSLVSSKDETRQGQTKDYQKWCPFFLNHTVELKVFD